MHLPHFVPSWREFQIVDRHIRNKKTDNEKLADDGEFFILIIVMQSAE
jgi:hypothetical protein